MKQVVQKQKTLETDPTEATMTTTTEGNFFFLGRSKLNDRNEKKIFPNFKNNFMSSTSYLYQQSAV